MRRFSGPDALLLVLPLLFTALPGRARVRLETSLEPKEVTVGQPFQLKVTAVADEGVRFQPFVPAPSAPFEVIAFSSGPAQKTGAEPRQEWTVTLRLFEVGLSTLPALSVPYRTAGGVARSVETPAIPVRVRTVLTDKDRQFHGMKGGLKKVLDRRRLAALLGALLLAVLVGFLLRWRRPRIPQPVGPPPRPAHEVALEALDRLGTDSELPDKPYYSRLTEILRQYLEGRYAVPAMDQTTAETSAALKTLHLTAETRSSLRAVLDNSDLAKFAKGVLSPGERTADLERVRTFVSATRLSSTADFGRGGRGVEERP
ncbi:MAG: hypothetical protein IPN65_06135 [Elusimicrobia bacterium]|nr:hypothetical protein [Elusimicrobiota bacterium]MBK7545253.1 hypothetical protein [Elusimicrobiota bacterium]MBK7575733.1 hypothetical protein [Elusimicrobiota bacterium]MBK8423736.1 hypothetical protein [Elusimicrobiota bacterium]MBK9430054.1 hypothetical protein [Elusimicrobiota bacterium]